MFTHRTPLKSLHQSRVLYTLTEGQFIVERINGHIKVSIDLPNQNIDVQTEHNTLHVVRKKIILPRND